MQTLPFIPLSTYRFQFHSKFPFRAAIDQDLVTYLHDLGISDCYSSPILQARPGSTHGYDVVNHKLINPEIGSYEEFEKIAKSLQDQGLGFLLDIVPNHMGIGHHSNLWWMDVLENGQSSYYANYLDVDWERPILQGKILVPFLGGPFGEVLERGELKIVYDKETKSFLIKYWDNQYPVDPNTYSAILERALLILTSKGEPNQVISINGLSQLIEQSRRLPRNNEIDEPRKQLRRESILELKEQLYRLYIDNEVVRQHIEKALVVINGQPGQPESFDLLEDLIVNQPYRLSYWRLAADEVNYRRFFEINDLLCLRMEDEKVYNDAHELIFKWIKEKKVTGLRIDHPDGLYDPTGYFIRLQESVRSLLSTSEQKPLYLLIEKILEHGEWLNQQWMVHGTTGYDFMNLINGVYINTKNESVFRCLYKNFSGVDTDPGRFDDLLYQSKKYMLETTMQSELNVLATLLHSILKTHRTTWDYSCNKLKQAICEIIACFPVYRTFITKDTIDLVSEVDKKYILESIEKAMTRNKSIDGTIYDIISSILTGNYKCSKHFATIIRFIMRFQQLTGPVMAKGLEDTSFYRFFLLTSLNEVGGSPDLFGISLDYFYHENRKRALHWPHSMSSSSTHDTKRSEDVRARINVLSEIPSEWQTYCDKWYLINHAHKKEHSIHGKVPKPNEELLYYQTLVGAWPILEQSADKEFIKRITDYMMKSAKEAKLYTSWTQPDSEYEDALTHFISQTLQDASFISDFLKLHPKISECGKWNSLSQLILKLTCPGVPDIYQGTEFWDFSLVDPDNRRPVDYNARKIALSSIKKAISSNTDLSQYITELISLSNNGHIKMFILHRLLQLRKDHSQLFTRGNFESLSPKGEHADNVIAFTREYQDSRVTVIVSRFFTQIQSEKGGFIWGDTTVPLNKASKFVDAISGKVIDTIAPELELSQILSELPFCVLLQHNNIRK